MSIAQLAIVSGLLQALGYAVYIWKSLREETDPNPSTWLMFAYGTALLTVLEWDRDAHFELLILPIVCAVLSIVVAGICYFRGTLAWPKELTSRAAFGTDIVLTFGYVSIGLASIIGLAPEENRKMLALLFLILSNTSTFASFVPTLVGTWKEPKNEHWLPWTVWACAYTTLGFVTLREKGDWNELMIYPVSCALLHGLVALLALRGWSCKICTSQALDA